MPRQFQLADDLRAQKRDDIRADGELESGKDFFRDRRAADDVTAFEYEDLASGPREVRGRRQPVVARTNNDGVVFRRHFRIVVDGHVYSGDARRDAVSRSDAPTRAEPELPRVGRLLRAECVRAAA